MVAWSSMIAPTQLEVLLPPEPIKSFLLLPDPLAKENSPSYRSEGAVVAEDPYRTVISDSLDVGMVFYPLDLGYPYICIHFFDKDTSMRIFFTFKFHFYVIFPMIWVSSNVVDYLENYRTYIIMSSV